MSVSKFLSIRLFNTNMFPVTSTPSTSPIRNTLFAITVTSAYFRRIPSLSFRFAWSGGTYIHTWMLDSSLFIPKDTSPTTRSSSDQSEKEKRAIILVVTPPV